MTRADDSGTQYPAAKDAIVACVACGAHRPEKPVVIDLRRAVCAVCGGQDFELEPSGHTEA